MSVNFNMCDSNSYNMDEDVKDQLSFLIQALNNERKVTEKVHLLQKISHSCLHKIPLCEIESQCLRIIFPEIKEYLNVVFIEITKVVNDSKACEKLKGWLETGVQLLQICGEIVEYIKSFNKIDVSSIRSLPITLLDILLTTFTHCKNSNNLYGEYFNSLRQPLTCLFKTAQTLQNIYLFIIMNNLNFAEHIDMLVEALDRMALIGEILPDLNAKAMADQWKGYATLVQMNCHHLQYGLDISLPFKCLIKQIQINMATVLETDISTEDNFKCCLSTLKATNFLLTVIIKLNDCFPNNPNYPHKEIITLLVTLNRYSSPYLHFKKCPAKLIDLIESYVTTAAEVLLGNFINVDSFIQCFFEDINIYVHNDDLKLGFLFLCLSIIRRIVLKESLLTLHSDGNWIGDKLLKMMFQIIPLYHFQLMCNLLIPSYTELGQNRRIISLYEVLLSHSAAIAIHSTSEYFSHLEKLLMENILQTNFWKAVLAMDMWSIIDRYGTDDLTLAHVTGLFNIARSFLISDYFTPESIYLNEILKRLFVLLSGESKLKLVQKYPIEKNVEVWNIIGLKNIPNVVFIEKVLTISLTKVSNRLEHLKLKKPLIQEWVYMCKEMLSLKNAYTSETNSNLLNQMVSTLFQLWSLNLSLSSLRSNEVFQNFIICLLGVTVDFVKNFNNSELLLILQRIHFHIKLNPTFQLIVLQLLKQLSVKQIENCLEQNRLLQLIADLFDNLLTADNVFIKEKAFEVFVEFSHITKHEIIVAMTVKTDSTLRMSVANYIQKIIHLEKYINSEEYYFMQGNVRFKHICRNYGTNVNVGPQMKKPKLVPDINITSVVKRIQADVDIAIDYCKNNKLSSEDLIELTEILQKLHKIAHK